MALFYITVPTRDYEINLRQKELEVQRSRLSIGPITSIKTDSDERTTSATLEPPPNLLQPNADSEVYHGKSDDKETDIIVHDFMEVQEVVAGTRKKSIEIDEEIVAEISKYFLERHLEDTLEKYDLHESAIWNTSYGGKMSIVSFTVSVNLSELVIQRLQSVGIGSKYGSTIVVCSADVYYGPKKSLLEGAEGEKTEAELAETEGNERKKGTGWSDFVQSIKSRLTVAQVVSQVQANAIITFDFLMLIFVAGTIACLGLLENNSVILVASMLISPLMGPIMALTFGAMIRDGTLLKVGVKSELIGLFICLIVGFISGILIAIPHEFDGPWGWNRVKIWPTDVMVNRGQLWAMSIGFLISVPSGIGVALSVLAGNTGSLVGVAIAASLLPPAVNCGLFWGMSLVAWIHEGVQTKRWYQSCHTALLETKLIRFHSKNYKFVYCVNDVVEFMCLGTVSFGLTLVNIVVIFAVAVLILKIKEVAPYTSRASLRRFWKEDLAATRNYNASHGDHDIADIIDDINNAEDSQEIKEKLDQDQVIRQINRRMGMAPFGPSIVSDMKSQAEYRKQIKAKELKNLKSTQVVASGGWFEWFRGGDRHKDTLISQNSKINKIS